MASQDTKAELMKQCRKYFNAIDKNGDGKLSPNEFSAMCKEMGCSSDMIALKRSYKKADKDSDGTVTFAEFMKAFAIDDGKFRKSVSGITQQKSDVENDMYDKDQVVKEVRRYFQEIDSDGSGKLGPSEFAEMLKKIGVHIEQTELMKVYHKADSNGDGEVSFREFLSAYTKEIGRNMGDGGRNTVSLQPPLKLGDNKEEDFRGGIAYFWKSDKDLDGRLNITEYTFLVNSLGMKLSKRDIEKAFNVVDRSHQGYVSFMDFVTTYINEIIPGALTKKKIQEIYQECDKGGKGFLTSLEFHQCMEMLGNTAKDEKLDKLMVSGNKHSAGKLDFPDFCELLGLGVNDRSLNQGGSKERKVIQSDRRK